MIPISDDNPTIRTPVVTYLLLATMLLGATFIGIKSVEYVHKFEQELFPNINFFYPGTEPTQARLFFSLYFIMTGLHAIHMLLGVLALGGLAFMGWRKAFSAQNYVPVEMVGLYWHFIDIIWIFIFPLLYLIGRAR
jgi:cytochrome c oxidase subunit 3